MNGVPAWLTPRRAAIAAAAVVALLYLAAVPGPLRVDTDSALLLRIAASLADGTGLHPPGSQSFPPGYPVLLAALDIAGVAGPASFMLLGMAALAVAIAASWVALRTDLRLTQAETFVVLLLTALSVYSIKYAVLPLTEMPFFAVSAVAVAALARVRAGGSFVWLVTGVALTGVACTIRTAGIALALAVVLAFPSARGRLIAAAAGAAGALAAISIAPYYLESLVTHWRESPGLAVWQEPWWFVRTSGAALANVPNSRWSDDPVVPITVLAGLAILAVTAWALWSRRSSLGPVDGWVVGTLGIVFLFPTEHPRFFLPVLPFLFGYFALAARHLPRLGAACAATFAAVGLVGLVYSSALSYTGTRFPDHYAAGRLGPTYRVAWGIGRPEDRHGIDERALWALRRYDPDPPWLP